MNHHPVGHGGHIIPSFMHDNHSQRPAPDMIHDLHRHIVQQHGGQPTLKITPAHQRHAPPILKTQGRILPSNVGMTRGPVQINDSIEKPILAHSSKSSWQSKMTPPYKPGVHNNVVMGRKPIDPKWLLKKKLNQSIQKK